MTPKRSTPESRGRSEPADRLALATGLTVPERAARRLLLGISEVPCGLGAKISHLTPQSLYIQASLRKY
jgi:hypothetical protein